MYERQPSGIEELDFLEAFQHAKECYPTIAGGVFSKDYGFLAYENEADEPKIAFKSKKYDDFLKKEEVIAIFRSNPDARAFPSEKQMAEQIKRGMCWSIAAMNQDGEVADFFFWGSNNIPVLIDREYRPGTMDCYALVKDALFAWFGISIPDIPRNTKSNGAFEEILNKYFVKIAPEELTMGDVAVGSILNKGLLNHVAIAVNNKEFLHQFSNKKSEIISIEKLKNMTKGYYRHIQLKSHDLQLEIEDIEKNEL